MDKNDLIKMYPPVVKTGNGELPICFPSELNLHFGWGVPSCPCLITEA